MAKKKKQQQPQKHLHPSKLVQKQQQPPRIDCYEGARLDDLLLKLGRSIEAMKQSRGGLLPERIWIKQHFAIGVNEVTRVLERMPGAEAGASTAGGARAAPLVPLQAVLLAFDAHPRMLTKHVPNLASSRQVPVIFVKDNKGGSLRLGELLKVKTAMAIGVKARESTVNETISKVLCGDSVAVDTLEVTRLTGAH